jgi:pimeloyl-ACP methyl ester carboxylesterase
MGGMIAQVIAQQQPQLVRKMILAGTGRRHRQGDPHHLPRHRARTAHPPGPQAVSLLHQDPERAPRRQEFLARLEERTTDRDKAISVRSFRAQLKAIHRWGQQKPADLGSIHQPVLVINGESDKMVPTKNTVDLDRGLPNSQLIVYPDAGHGGVFQFHEDFVKRALEFL